MREAKFDQLDRERVIREVENHLGLRLEPCGRRPKVLVDGTGNVYVVIGGYKDWHGLPKELVEGGQEGTLVIAKVSGDIFRVFTGPLAPLVRNAESLAAHEDGNFSFDVDWKSDHAIIKQIPDARLSLLRAFTYPREEKEKDKTVRPLKRKIAGMSRDERDALLKSITD